jgi:hypothetical protein
MKFMDKAAETVLAALSEVYALDDVQQIVDQTCARVVEAFPWQRALLSLYFGPDVYVGLAGGDEELRRYFWRRARETTEESRRERRQLIWSKHRIPGTNICFIPAESDVPLGDSFAPSPEDPGAEWQPNDRLMMYVRGADNEVRGVFALDEPMVEHRDVSREVVGVPDGAQDRVGGLLAREDQRANLLTVVDGVHDRPAPVRDD